MYFWFYIFLSLCFTQLPVYAKKDIVKVSLYYESLCPYSISFITEQLYPGYEELGDKIILDLVPYGKANQTYIDGKWNFQCQHGPRECQGNKIQACVLGKAFARNSKIGFVNCMMNSTNPSSVENGKNCAIANNLRWLPISLCVNSIDGERILAHYGERTKSLIPKLRYVPHILFNGIFNETLEEEARDDFVKTVCSLFTDKPDTCDRDQ